eukprot:m.5664 g.5664  ORF g.5664 m.5664 type:complete len:960 (-) comp3356_c0_seq1:93-2972(-)
MMSKGSYEDFLLKIIKSDNSVDLKSRKRNLDLVCNPSFVDPFLQRSNCPNVADLHGKVLRMLLVWARVREDDVFEPSQKTIDNSTNSQPSQASDADTSSENDQTKEGLGTPGPGTAQALGNIKELGTQMLAITALGKWAKNYPEAVANMISQKDIDSLMSNRQLLAYKLMTVRELLNVIKNRKPTILAMSCKIVRESMSEYVTSASAHDHKMELRTAAELADLLHTFPETLPRNNLLDLLFMLLSWAASFPVLDTNDKVTLDLVATIASFMSVLWETTIKRDHTNGIKGLEKILQLMLRETENNEVSILLAVGACTVPSALIQHGSQFIVTAAKLDERQCALLLRQMTRWIRWPAFGLERSLAPEQWIFSVMGELSIRKQLKYMELATTQCIRELISIFERGGNLSLAVTVLIRFVVNNSCSADTFKEVVLKLEHIVNVIREKNNAYMKQDSMKKEFCELARALIHLNFLTHTFAQIRPEFSKSYSTISGTIGFPPPKPEAIQKFYARHLWPTEPLNPTLPQTSSLPNGNGKAVALPGPHERVGLVNLGNTCYANSIMQAMFAVPAFLRALFAVGRESKGTHGTVLQETMNLFSFLALSHRKSISPISFVHKTRPPWFQAGAQQDCVEFMQYYLDQLESNCKKAATERRLSLQSDSNNNKKARITPPSEASAAEDDYVEDATSIFRGRSMTNVVCTKCGTISARKEDFNALSLAFPENSVEKDLKVEHLITNFLSKEQLVGSNQYQCEKCEELRDAEQEVVVLEPPECLILTLNRFAYDKTAQRRIKLMQEVSISPQIELPVFDEESPRRVVYNLLGVVIHSGLSPSSGHYFSFVRDHNDDNDGSPQWKLCNDSHVQKSSLNMMEKFCAQVKQNTPYVLFYEKNRQPFQTDKVSKELHSMVETDNTKYSRELSQGSALSAASSHSWYGSKSQYPRKPDDDSSDQGGSALGSSSMPRFVS